MKPKPIEPISGIVRRDGFLILLFSLFTLSLYSNPKATILTPTAGTRYSGGDEFAFTGVGYDSIEGNLPVANFQWSIWFHHENHWHDEPPFLYGKDHGNIYISTNGETSGNVFYRLWLVVENSAGDYDTTYVDILPRTSTVTVNTIPPGLGVRFEGPPNPTPLSLLTVENLEWVMSVDSIQTDANNKTYAFDHWTNGSKSLYQGFNVPVNDTSFTAVFAEVTGVTDAANLSNLRVYPNPAKDNITVELSEKYSSVEITIYDCYAVIRKKRSIQHVLDPKIKIDTMDLSPGVYCISVISGNDKKMQKILIE